MKYLSNNDYICKNTMHKAENSSVQKKTRGRDVSDYIFLNKWEKVNDWLLWYFFSHYHEDRPVAMRKQSFGNNYSLLHNNFKAIRFVLY